MVEVADGLDYKLYEQELDDIEYTYSMIDLGNGEFHLLYADLFDKVSECRFGIEARVNNAGNYETISINTPDFERVLYTDGFNMIGDHICVKSNKFKNELYEVVYCSDGINGEISLEDYLKTKPRFVNIDCGEYVPYFDTNAMLRSFLETNRIIKNQSQLVRVPSFE